MVRCVATSAQFESRVPPWNFDASTRPLGPRLRNHLASPAAAGYRRNSGQLRGSPQANRLTVWCRLGQAWNSSALPQGEAWPHRMDLAWRSRGVDIQMPTGNVSPIGVPTCVSRVRTRRFPLGSGRAPALPVAPANAIGKRLGCGCLRSGGDCAPTSRATKPNHPDTGGEKPAATARGAPHAQGASGTTAASEAIAAAESRATRAPEGSGGRIRDIVLHTSLDPRRASP
jgi:hypothetical protein